MSNGITLPTADAGDANLVINFNQDIYAFEQDPVVMAFLAKYSSGRALVDITTAINNFNTTILATDSTVILDLTGKHLTSTNTMNICNNSASFFTTLSYDVTVTGYHEYGTSGLG